MTRPNNRHGEDRHEVRDPPPHRNEGPQGQNNHSRDSQEADCKAVLEALEHARHFDEEVGELGFFGGRAPLHVVFEHVREERGGDMQRQPAEEDGEHEHPFEVFD